MALSSYVLPGSRQQRSSSSSRSAAGAWWTLASWYVRCVASSPAGDWLWRRQQICLRRRWRGRVICDRWGVNDRTPWWCGSAAGLGLLSAGTAEISVSERHLTQACSRREAAACSHRLLRLRRRLTPTIWLLLLLLLVMTKTCPATINAALTVSAAATCVDISSAKRLFTDRPTAITAPTSCGVWSARAICAKVSWLRCLSSGVASECTWAIVLMEQIFVGATRTSNWPFWGQRSLNTWGVCRLSVCMSGVCNGYIVAQR